MARRQRVLSVTGAYESLDRRLGKRGRGNHQHQCHQFHSRGQRFLPCPRLTGSMIRLSLLVPTGNVKCGWTVVFGQLQMANGHCSALSSNDVVSTSSTTPAASHLRSRTGSMAGAAICVRSQYYADPILTTDRTIDY